MYPILFRYYGGYFPYYSDWSRSGIGDCWGYYISYGSGNWQQQQEELGYRNIELKDYGKQPYIVDLEEAAEQNRNYRLALWTGKNLQLTLMSINPGESIGLEVHPNVDQYLRIEEGRGLAKMGPTENNLNIHQPVEEGYAIFVPAGTWHDIVNTGYEPLKLTVIYAPPEHPFGTIHETKQIAAQAE